MLSEDRWYRLSQPDDPQWSSTATTSVHSKARPNANAANANANNKRKANGNVHAPDRTFGGQSHTYSTNTFGNPDAFKADPNPNPNPNLNATPMPFGARLPPPAPATARPAPRVDPLGPAGGWAGPAAVQTPLEEAPRFLSAQHVAAQQEVEEQRKQKQV